MDRQIKVEREIYTKNGKEYFAYFIRGKVRGRDVKVAVSPPDIGGYTVLDIVFDTEMSADLVITPFEMKNANGETITGNTYMVRSYDENGEVYECKVKPTKVSDKNMLNMLLR